MVRVETIYKSQRDVHLKKKLNPQVISTNQLVTTANFQQRFPISRFPPSVSRAPNAVVPSAAAPLLPWSLLGEQFYEFSMGIESMNIGV